MILTMPPSSFIIINAKKNTNLVQCAAVKSQTLTLFKGQLKIAMCFSVSSGNDPGLFAKLFSSKPSWLPLPSIWKAFQLCVKHFLFESYLPCN